MRAHFAAILLAALLAVVAPARAQTLAITGATIIDGTGNPALSDGVVVITAGRITAVGRSRDVAMPSQATRLDARGKYIIPGLMDAHMHLCNCFENLDNLIQYEARYDELILEAAQLALKMGQTTIFDTWGPRAALVKARDLINAGKAPGSRIYLNGSVIGWSGPLGPDLLYPAAAHFSPSLRQRINKMFEQGMGRKLLWMTPEEVRAGVRQYTQKNVDFLKYGATQHHDSNPYMPDGLGPDLILFSPRVQRGIVEEGHRAGLTVQAHTTTVESLDMAIDAGVDLVAHGDLTGPTTAIPEATLRKLVERGVAVAVRPTTERNLQEREKRPQWPYAALQRIERTNQRNMIRAGVRMLVSTDGGGRDEGYFDALLGLEELGMDRMEIVKSATSHVAKAYGLDRKIGTLEPGKLADLVLLDANPLESARNYRRMHAVIKDGRVVDRKALPVAPILSSQARAR